MAAGTWLCCGADAGRPHPVPERTHEMTYDDLAGQAEQQFWADLASAQPDGSTLELANAIELAGQRVLELPFPAGEDYGGLDDYALADAIASASLEAEQARQVQDAERSLIVPRGTDERLEAAFARIEAGTYVPEGEYARQAGNDDPDDLSGRYAPQNCGISDYFGRCAAAVHEAGCSHNLGNPAGLDVHEIEAWRSAMNKRSGPAGLDAELYETAGGQGRDAGYHLLATRLGLTHTPGDTVLARTSAGAQAQAAQALQQGAVPPW
jgi:hypothetical protein